MRLVKERILVYFSVFMLINTCVLAKSIFFYSVYSEKKESELFGFKQQDGKILTVAEYDYLYEFADSVGVTGIIDSDVLLFDSDGKLIRKISQATALCPIEEVSRAFPNMLDGKFSHSLMPLGYHTDEESYWGYIWGYIDKTGRIAIKPQFVVTMGFSEGLAASLIYIENEQTKILEMKWGFIAPSGKFAIRAQFDAASNFSEGYAAVMFLTDSVDFAGDPISKWGFIAQNGELVLPAIYYGAYRFSEGYAQVLLQTGQDIETGMPIYQWGFIDVKGNLVIKPVYDDCFPFSEGVAATGLAKVPYYGEGDPICNWGYIDTLGNIVIGHTYEFAMPFSEGLAAVAVPKEEVVDDDVLPDLLWGFINKEGVFVIEPRYQNVTCFKNGKAKVQYFSDDNKLMVSEIDKRGNYLFKPIEGAWYPPFTLSLDKFYR